MTVTAEIRTRFRTFTTADNAVLSDEQIDILVGNHAVADLFGTDPLEWDMSTTPPTSSANSAWVASYDLHAAAAEWWEKQAAEAAGKFDFEADGGSYKRSQLIEQAERMIRYHRSRRQAAGRLI